MSEIKALEKLRELLDVEIGEAEPYFKGVAICDEIEAEIAERYMELPVDADGVPIHMGDSVEGELLFDNATVRGTVCAYHIHDGDEPGTVYIRVKPTENTWTIKELRFKRCRHVKPRTLENIVADAIQYGHNGITGDRIECKVAEFCAEIRELMGGEGEGHAQEMV